jgi:hypothetical protein
MSKSGAERALRNFYEFGDEDLDANRQGQLTEKQLQEIQGRNNTFHMLGYGVGGAAMLLALLLVGLFCLVLLLWVLSKSWAGAAAGIPAFVGGILVLGGGGFWFMRFMLAKAKSNYVLRSTRGPVHLSAVNVSTRRGSYQESHMEIGGVLFVLEDELVGKIKEGEDYAVYYLDYQGGSEGIIQSLEKFD